MIIKKRFSEVNPEWIGNTVVCVASGPSLTAEQCAYLYERRAKVKVIAINDAYLMVPFCDLLYFADKRWYDWHKDRAEFKGCAATRVTIEAHDQVDEPSIHVLRNAGVEGLSLDQGAIKNGRTSGYQALNLAVLTGAKRIVLLGYDYKYKNSLAHFFGNHPGPQSSEDELRQFAQRFSTLENPLIEIGVKVFNCSKDSELKQFPIVGIETAIP